jgi:hypothetical protein
MDSWIDIVAEFEAEISTHFYVDHVYYFFTITNVSFILLRCVTHLIRWIV